MNFKIFTICNLVPFFDQSELRTIPEELLQRIKWEVEQELGTMRDQFTQELRNMANRTGQEHSHKEPADLSQFYAAACQQINSLK